MVSKYTPEVNESVGWSLELDKSNSFMNSIELNKLDKAANVLRMSLQ